MDELLSRLENGETMTNICRNREDGTPREKGEWPSQMAFYNWADPKLTEYDASFALSFARARIQQKRVWQDECVDIANSPEPGLEEVLTDSEKFGVSRKAVRKDMLGHRQLKIETRLKIMARIDEDKWLRIAAGEPVEEPKAAQDLTVTVRVEGGLPSREQAAQPEPEDPFAETVEDAPVSPEPQE